MRNRLIKISKWLIGVYLLICVALYFFQEKIIFQASQLDPNHKFEFGEPFVEKDINMPDGEKVNTLFFKTAKRSKGLIFYCHGNKRNLKVWGRFADNFTKNGYDVFMWDYRGFGKSKGEPSEESILQDAEYLYTKMKEKYPEKRIILYGRSLGTGVATFLASQNHPKKLLLETPYFNLADVGWKHLPIFPYQFLIKHPFRTDKYISKVTCPIHIFHGTKDELVPYESSLELAKVIAQNPDKLITTIPSGHHRGLERYDQYQKDLKEQLK